MSLNFFFVFKQMKVALFLIQKANLHRMYFFPLFYFPDTAMSSLSNFLNYLIAPDHGTSINFNSKSLFLGNQESDFLYFQSLFGRFVFFEGISNARLFCGTGCIFLIPPMFGTLLMLIKLCLGHKSPISAK